MARQQQEQRPDQRDTRSKQRRRLSRRSLVIIAVLFLAVAIIITWILSYLNVIPGFLASIFTIIIAVLGAVFAFFQSLHLFIPADEQISREDPPQSRANLYMPYTQAPSPQMPPIIVQVPSTQTHPSLLPLPDKTSYRGIVGLPPPTNPRTIQQREQIVREAYTKLIQPDITAIALTGIGGVGKSTLAALIYRYVEEQRQTHTGPFLAETLWLTIDPAATFADLAGNLFEALGGPLPDLGNLAPQNQAVALFNLLNTSDKPRLVILDQFENLLNWNSGHALTDRPGVGEWLDIINGQQCGCRLLLTSRPRPVGTREYPPTYLQEYLVRGLEVHEGIALLESQGVQGTETELQAAVLNCAGHALSLMLLASLIRDHYMNLSTLFKDATLWTGDIAINLLDQIYTQQLTEVQRELLLAFSMYREPVPLDAALAITNRSLSAVQPAIKALITQHLLEAVGEGNYRLHVIIANHVKDRYTESNEQTNQDFLRLAFVRAAQYYLQQAKLTCPAKEHRAQITDLHDLIEAIWLLCQADQRQEAFDLMEREEIFEDLKRWGGNVILLELYQSLLPLAKSKPEQLQAAIIYINLGRVYRTLGYKLQAQQYLELALSIARMAGDRKEEGTALSFLGRVYADLGQKERARSYLLEALHIREEIKDRRGEGWTLDNLGRVLADLGQKERARQLCEQALSIHREVGDHKGEGTTLNYLGMMYDDLGEKETALNYFEQALQIRREVRDRGGVGATLNNLGRVYNVLGEKETALKYFEQALQINREVGDRMREGVALSNLGRVKFALGDKEEALRYCEQALEIFEKIGDRAGEARVLNNLAAFYDVLGKYREALEHYERALGIFRMIADLGGEGVALNNIGRIYKAIGKEKQALENYKQALRINREVGDRGGEGVTLHNIGTIYLEQESYNVALAYFLLAMKIFEKVQSPSLAISQRYIERLQAELGKDEFTVMLANIEPQAQYIVDQALGELKQFPG